MQELLLFPYSGTAIEALDCLGDEWQCIGFVSDDSTVIGKEYFNIKVYGREAFHRFPNVKVLAVHGSPNSYLQRETILNTLPVALGRFATVIHKKACVSPLARVGYNVLIMAGVVVTANAVIGNHVIILPNSVVHHDSSVGDFTLIGANTTIAGNVSIGSNCYIGASGSIKNGITLGNQVLVGMGANVVRSYGNNNIVIGNPAKPIHTK